MKKLKILKYQIKIINAKELFFAEPVSADVLLVVSEGGPRHLFEAESTGGRQFGHGLLHRKVPDALSPADLTSTLRTRGILVLDPRVCQQVVQTTHTHQVPVAALWKVVWQELLKCKVMRKFLIFI